MTRSSTFIFIFVAIFAFCFITSTVAQAAAADFQQDELYQFLNQRYPNLYNRALRSMGKPTFIRFGKRSGSPLSSMGHQQQQQQPQYPFEQIQQQQQQWSQ